MSVGKHETVTVEPTRVGRVVPKVAAPEDFSDFGHAHRHAGVTGVRLLNRIHGQGADDASQGGKSTAHNDSPIEK
jgi:hypothetical protein